MTVISSYFITGDKLKPLVSIVINGISGQLLLVVTIAIHWSSIDHSGTVSSGLV